MQAVSSLFRQRLALGQTLIKLRLRNNYSQQVVAQLIGVSQSTYSRLESDLQQPTLDQLQRFAELYELPVDRLITGCLDPKPAAVAPTFPASIFPGKSWGGLDDMLNSYQEALSACRKLNEVLEAENQLLRQRLSSLVSN